MAGEDTRLSLLNAEYRKQAMQIYRAGQGLCYRCRRIHGCWHCNGDKAVSYFLRKQAREEEQAMSELQGQEGREGVLKNNRRSQKEIVRPVWVHYFKGFFGFPELTFWHSYCFLALLPEGAA